METLSKLSIRQLQYFIAAGELGSFRKAATQLGVTQPTLTAQISALETSLGVVLFERARTGTTLTAVGRDLISGGRRTLEEARGLVERATSYSGGVAGTYRMGVTPTLGPYLLPHILPNIHSRYAELKLYVREGAPADLESELRDGRHDMILTALPMSTANLTIVNLIREPLKLAMAADHPLAQRPEVTRDDMVGQEVLTIGEHHLFHRQITRLCEKLGADLRRDYEGTSLDTLRHMVTMGLGMAFLPALYVESEIRPSDPLRVTDIKDENLYRIHALAWRPTSPSRQLFAELSQLMRSLITAKLGHLVTPLNK